MGYFKTFRSDIHSLFQSAVDELIPRAAEHFGRPDEDHLLAQATQRICEFKEQQKRVPMHALKGLSDAHGAVDKAWNGLRLLFDLFEARLEGNHELAVKIEDELKFSDIDPEWVDTINRYLEYFGVDGKKQAIPYIRHANMSDFVLNTLPPNATVALIGDWGTGTDEAVNLLRQVQRKQPDVVIHMGDIYYSGTAKENQSYFLDIFEKILDRTRIPVYSLTGNHDMYSGGHGYYEMIRKLNPSPPFDPAQAQPASYFSLRTTDGAWQFLVMDTSLNDHDVFEVADAVTYLDPLEEAWHLDKLANFSGRTILLSHHQLFSAFDGIGKVESRPDDAQRAFNPNLLASFRRFREKGDIAAWFWGHEHNLCVYKPYPPLDKGRCIGHGAIPVFVEDEPYTVMKSLSSPPELVDDPRKPGEKLTLDKNGKIYTHGYVLIKLDDRTKTAQASYYQDTDENTPMYTETL